jgi:hypothetical protein
MLPNFIICGAQKGGTTALYHYLRVHPDVFIPDAKEINFFGHDFCRGVSWYEPAFAGWKGESAVGEASPEYMIYPEVAPNIASVLPKAKLLFVLRNPIERAYSGYWFYAQLYLNMQHVERPKDFFAHQVRLLTTRNVEKHDPIQPFSKAIRTETGHALYIERGLYYKHIKRFLEHFDRRQIHCIISEDLTKDPREVLRRCFEFLGVDQSHIPDNIGVHNPTLYPRSFALNKVLFLWARPFAKKYIWPVLPATVQKGQDRIHDMIQKVFFSGKRPDMNEDDRQYLRGIYRVPNEELGRFLGRDLSFWK